MASKFSNNVFFLSSLLLISMIVIASGRQFKIGGSQGWIKPAGNDTQIYDEWAEKNRFHIGDSIYFKYQNDSVLVVNYPNFANCIVANPVSKFENGNTVFRFDRYGYFYFISGEQDHCKAGQKVVIRVMVHLRVEPPSIAPAPQDESGSAGSSSSSDWGPPTPNSSVKLPIASYLMTAVGGMMVLCYVGFVRVF